MSSIGIKNLNKDMDLAFIGLFRHEKGNSLLNFAFHLDHHPRNHLHGSFYNFPR